VSAPVTYALVAAPATVTFRIRPSPIFGRVVIDCPEGWSTYERDPYMGIRVDGRLDVLAMGYPDLGAWARDAIARTAVLVFGDACERTVTVAAGVGISARRSKP